MKAFRNTQQIRKDLLQNCISKTQTLTTDNCPINTMEFANNLNPDIYEERMYNSLFNNNDQYQHFHKSLKNNNSNNSFYSQAQIDRMKNYINRYPIQNDYMLFKKV